MRSSTLIYNPAAGGYNPNRERQVREAARLIERSGFGVELAPTAGPGAALGLARQAAARGDELVLACGGDGTINEVVNGLAGSRSALGVLPAGTANILAKELRLPHNPVRAARDLPRWQARRIALGKLVSREGPGDEARERYFMSVAGVGFDAHVIRSLARGAGRSLGVAAYALEAWRQAFRYAYPRFLCRVNGREISATFAVVSRACNYAGWLHMAPRARLFEPNLTVTLFKKPGTARYLFYGAAVVARLHARLRSVETFDAKQVSLTSADPAVEIYTEVDGELAGKLPATVEIVPDALTLLVP